MSKPPDLKQIATVPPEIVEAGAAGELVLFVGAGLSMLRGFPSWKGFAQNALALLRDKGKINYSEVAQLERLDPKKQLSIAKLIADDSSVDLDFSAALGDGKKLSKIYDYINEIGCVCVTTNYDELLVPKSMTDGGKEEGSITAPPVMRFNDPSDFLSKHLDEPGTVVHLHGSVSKPSAMVVTTQQYLAHYEMPMVRQLLSDLFAKKTVLFVGYGLDELEVLEYILRRGDATATKDRRRFALQGYFLHDVFLYQRMHDYYDRSFGVQLIGFALDHESYEQQVSILRDWSEKIKINKPPLVKDLAVITAALVNG